MSRSLLGEKIAVLAGGPSCEREISLISGKAVYEALRSKNIPAVFVDALDDFLSVLRREGATVAFLALHGAFGEDGTVQRLLEKEGIPYTGSGAEASETAFDKSRAQVLFQKNGVRVPEFLILRNRADLKSTALFPPPVVVKPARCGSSVGVSIVFSENELERALEEAFRYGDAVLVDRYIQGRELTVGILGDRALPVVEVMVRRKFYDYEAKYGDSGTRYEFPAKLRPKEVKEVTELALKAYRVTGCEVMARVDIILGENGLPYVLEVNAIPGLTGKSLLPKAAQASGINFPDLCVRILDLSLNRIGVERVRSDETC